MPKETKETTVKTPRAKRTPRALTALEITAKKNLDDAKAIARITPIIESLGEYGIIAVSAIVVRLTNNAAAEVADT